MTQNGIPTETAKSDEYERFQRAAELLDEGKLEEAQELLAPLAGSGHYRDEALALLAVSFFEGGRLKEAITGFRELASRKPGSESASLGLFHALWEAGLTDEAVAEMRRYREKHESMEYRRLVRDLKAEGIVLS